MSRPHHFGVTRAHPNPIDVPEIERIAREHGATYYSEGRGGGPLALLPCDGLL